MTENEINCEQALRQIFEHIDHELGEAERPAMEQHLLTCKSCFSRVEFERRLKQKLSHLGQRGEDHVDASVRKRIERLMENF